LLQDRLLRELARFSPWINVFEAEKNRDKKDEHEWEIHEAGFKKAARGIAPAATGELMNHGDHEAAERKTDPKYPGEKIGKEELPFIEGNAESGETQCQQAKHQGGELNAIET